MKDKISNENDDALRDLFSNLDRLPEYDLRMETEIMEKVGHQLDHSVVMAKYKRWSRIGFLCSICLVLILMGFSIATIIESRHLEPDAMDIEHFLPSFFALIGLTLVFVQMEIRKGSRLNVDYNER